MAEQFPDGSGVQLVNPFEFLGMDAASDEQAIDPEALRAGQISPHRISDRKDVLELDRTAATSRDAAS